ncbi:MAG: L-histidine N(alpha)-methyltransferase [Marinilabiliaceae bacterium]
MQNNEPQLLKDTTVSISNYLEEENHDEVVRGIFKGLSASQKHISSRFFYDDRGSALFEEITSLPEYYPARTEKSILKKAAPEIMNGAGEKDIVEIGSGDCSKISLLLDAVSPGNLPGIHYFPLDVSSLAIRNSSDMLARKYKVIHIHGIMADFLKHLKFFPARADRLVCFFGSTLGNLERKDAQQFLVNVADLMDAGDHFLLGLDMVKDHEILEAAYNDKQGVTAAFNKNMLNVVNQYAGTNFDPELFDHYAFFNDIEARVEMHLVAREPMTISSSYFSSDVSIKKGETIHTENSHKFTHRHILEFSTITGLRIEEIFSDDNDWFSLVRFVK